MATGSNKQLFLNMSTNALAFVLSLSVSFFLTPYIVSQLGVAAYGFVGLSNNIIGYTGLITVALNSMSGRYITLHYHKGEMNRSNEFVAATFFANLFVAIIIGLGLSIFTIFIDSVIEIPDDLVSDVRILFLFLVINSLLGLVTGVFSVATFVKNQIQKTNIRNMIGTLLRCGLLLLLFTFLKPKLWFFGVTAIVMTTYIFSTNRYFFKSLTPELTINFNNFKISNVWTLVKSGLWNLISSLSNLLNEGFDLLFANLFISPTAMGLLSLTKTIPAYVTSFIVNLSGSFHPEYMKLFAEGKRDELKAAILKSIRILGFVTSIPVSILFAYGDIFYKNWLPDENTGILYALSCIGITLLMFSLPYQAIWYVFIIDNKLKRTSINALLNSSATFAIVLASMLVVKDTMARLFILASTRTVLSSFRCLTFLPLYASKVMNYPRYTFYTPIIKNIIMTAILVGFSLFLKSVFYGDTWGTLIVLSLITSVAGIFVGFYIMLLKSDRAFILSLIKSKLSFIKK